MLWDIQNKKYKVFESYELELKVTPLAVSPDGDYLFWASNIDHTAAVKLLDLRNMNLKSQIISIQLVTHIVYIDSKHVILGYNNGIAIWDIANNRHCVSAFLDEPLSCISVTKDGSTIVVGNGLGTIYCIRWSQREKK